MQPAYDRSAEAGVGSGAPPDRVARFDFLGAPLDCLSLAETVAAADAAMGSRSPLRQVSLNVAKVVAMRRSAELDRDVRASDLVCADGMGVFWAARLLGVPVTERVAGIDLFERVLALCAARGYRPYFLGARAEIVTEAVATARTRYPGLTFAGWRDGYFAAAEERSVVAEINASHADCLFIGMPTPRKERFLAGHADALDVPFIMGVGGSFDVLAGALRRAPVFVQRIGLEWLFRLIQEPLRLGPRYVKTNFIFSALLARALVKKLIGQ